MACGEEFESECPDTMTCEKKECRYDFRSANSAGVSIAEYRRRRQERWDRKAARRAAALAPASEVTAPAKEPSPAEPEALPPGPSRERAEWRPPDPPAPTGRTGRYEKILFIPDIHAGDQDDRAVALAISVAQHVRPEGLIQLGDAVDFYGLSKFDTNPMRFAYHIQQELDVQAAIYELFAEATPGAWRRQILGNHEERGLRLVWRNPALSGLRALSLPALMKLDQVGWEPQIHDFIQLAGGAFIARHGTYVRKWAGYSAKAELDSTHISGISGHTHAQAVYSLSTEAGELVWCEAGHLQNNPPSWRKSHRNWQQGVVLGEFETGGNAFDLTPIRFRRSYRCRVGGTELSA